MPKTLEVVVMSVEEAIEAERGGADRLELVNSLEEGGLTPPLALAEEVVRTVSIPVRIMVRQNPSMSIQSESELESLKATARGLSELPIDGLVLGYVAETSVDLISTAAILSRAPQHRATFHRAFECVSDPLRAIQDLKSMPQIDRILTTGGSGPPAERKARLLEWQRAAGPEIRILVGAGLSAEFLTELNAEPDLSEIHVGRAARLGESVTGRVSRHQIATLKSALG